MIFPRQPEPYDVQLASRYRLLTLTLLDAISRADETEMNVLFDQREQVFRELQGLPRLGEEAKHLLHEAATLNGRLVAALSTEQSTSAQGLLQIYRESRGTAGYRRSPLSAEAGLEETG